MEFLVEFEVNIPDGTPKSEIRDRQREEASAVARLGDEGRLVRLWGRRIAAGETRIVALFRVGSESELDALIEALPLYEWLHSSVTTLEPHPSDPAAAEANTSAAGRSQP